MAPCFHRSYHAPILSLSGRSLEGAGEAFTDGQQSHTERSQGMPIRDTQPVVSPLARTHRVGSRCTPTGPATQPDPRDGERVIRCRSGHKCRSARARMVNDVIFSEWL